MNQRSRELHLLLNQRFIIFALHPQPGNIPLSFLEEPLNQFAISRRVATRGGPFVKLEGDEYSGEHPKRFEAKQRPLSSLDLPDGTPDLTE